MTCELLLSVHHPSHAKVGTSRGVFAGRPTLVATLASDSGTAVGEATPLPGFADDSIAEAQLALSKLDAGELCSIAEDISRAFLSSPSANTEDPSSALELMGDFSCRIASPSARFCVEMIVLGAAAGSCGVPIAHLLTADLVADTLPQSAVIDPLRRDAEEELQRQMARGVRTIKVKVGRDNAAEIAFVQALTSSESQPRFRLDPNQAWTAKQAQAFLLGCDLTRLDWVEDPTPNPEDWPSLSRLTGAPLAIDEPLARNPDPALLESSGASVVVLKPMALGGFSACAQLARRARELGQQACVSHLFDGPLAMDACVQLAFAIQSPKVAPGLGEHEALFGYEKLGLGRPCSFAGAQLLPAPRH